MTITYFVVDNIWTLVSELGDFLGKMGDFKSSFTILQTPQEQSSHRNLHRLKNWFAASSAMSLHTYFLLDIVRLMSA